MNIKIRSYINFIPELYGKCKFYILNTDLSTNVNLFIYQSFNFTLKEKLGRSPILGRPMQLNKS